MSDRDGFQPGVPYWVATIQPDPAAAASFYGDLFEWEFEDSGGALLARRRGRAAAAIVPLPPELTPAPDPVWITDVQVADVEETAARVRDAGGSVLREPFDGASGRTAVIADPGGGVLGVVQPDRFKGAGVVNEPGAWAMSRLDTPDTDGGAAFYGSVFGWTTETFEMGEISATMFRLPGYVGGEPEQPVSREVVATMGPAPAGSRANWIADFWVHDVDAAAATAETRGGSVLAGPFDLPIGRNAILADPAGAAFSVSTITARAS